MYYNIEWRLFNAMNLGLPQNRKRLLILGALKKEATGDFPSIRLASTENLLELPESNFKTFTNFDNWTQIQAHSKRFPTWGIARVGRFFWE